MDIDWDSKIMLRVRNLDIEGLYVFYGYDGFGSMGSIRKYKKVFGGINGYLKDGLVLGIILMGMGYLWCFLLVKFVLVFFVSFM